MMRLDQRVRELFPDLSWTRVRAAIARGHVLVDGRVMQDAAVLIESTSEIQLEVNRPARPTARLDLPRLYEDEDILVIDKPAGLLTIPTDPSRRAIEDTVLARVKEYAQRRSGRAAYAGMLHRLDKDTSGALAVAMSRAAHAAGRGMFRAHQFERHYLAIVYGVPLRAHGVIDVPIAASYSGGRRGVARDRASGLTAITRFVVRETFEDAALLELELETGRQHQIRAHLEHLGHPVAGDRVYAGHARLPAPRQMLHAWRLSFAHPLSGEAVSVEAPLPPDFRKFLRSLRG
jgi:23S rRNA pseudouridine1911/1915/1917 synthase